MEKEFVTVLNRNQAALFKICKMYCADPEDRRDLFQEIVIQLWQAFPTFRGESGAGTWVYRIGMNTAISNFRKTKNRRSTSPFSSFDMEIPELHDNSEMPLDTAPLYQAIDQFNVIEKALVLMLVFAAILVGNPFDFTHWYQYAPCVIYALVIAAGLKIMIADHSTISKVTISKSNLRESLVTVIFVLEKCRAAMDRVWQFSMGAGLLICISLISRNFEKYGIEKSVLLITANIVVVGLLYLVARHYLKRFPDKNVQELRTQLHELAEVQNDSFGQR